MKAYKFNGEPGDWFVAKEEIFINEFGIQGIPIGAVTSDLSVVVDFITVWGKNKRAQDTAQLVSFCPDMFNLLKEILNETDNENIKNKINNLLTQITQKNEI
jgi:hypothetical protein